MSKLEKERFIIEEIKALNECGFGDYRSIHDLREIIATAMDYEAYPYRYGQGISLENDDEEMKLREIIGRMVKKNVIRLSKSGKMFVLCVE